MIENGGDSPTSQTIEVKQQVITTVERAAKALGIATGVAKGDMVFSNGQAKVIEIAGRLSGGTFQLRKFHWQRVLTSLKKQLN
ncbi:hypothetical protein [Shewanella dokdonensis]|uniref:hypothetical protein n=1 Tax=Shewanella dokdonensis TaxID=712036 RepID=UPI001FD57D53|nr:hypothetical protein [Shewanella dokdonensis]